MTDRKVERPMKRMRMEVENPCTIPIPEFVSPMDETSEIIKGFIGELFAHYGPDRRYRSKKEFDDIFNKIVSQSSAIILDNIKYLLTQPEGYIGSKEYHDNNRNVYFPIASILSQSNDVNVALATMDKFKDEHDESLDDEINEFVEHLLSERETMTDD